MNEREFKAKLRAKLKPHCYIQSMSSLATAGTPDLWLSDKKDLWLEVKYDEKTKNIVTPKLSALQKYWLDHRYAEGRQVIVICGTAPSEGIIFEHGAWNEGRFDRIPLNELIFKILEYVK